MPGSAPSQGGAWLASVLSVHDGKNKNIQSQSWFIFWPGSRLNSTVVETCAWFGLVRKVREVSNNTRERGPPISWTESLMSFVEDEARDADIVHTERGNQNRAGGLQLSILLYLLTEPISMVRLENFSSCFGAWNSKRHSLH